eukprot:2248463-Rhodomonas_salina.1
METDLMLSCVSFCRTKGLVGRELHRFTVRPRNRVLFPDPHEFAALGGTKAKVRKWYKLSTHVSVYMPQSELTDRKENNTATAEIYGRSTI